MARRKKPENESPEEYGIRHVLETVSDSATRSEKVSWDRKMDNMVALLAKLTPIEEQILDLLAAKAPIVDTITDLRREMIRDCVHPFMHLVHKGDSLAECKFCGKTFSVKTDGSGTKT